MKSTKNTVIFNSLFKDDMTANKFTTLKIRDIAIPLTQMNTYLDMFKRKYNLGGITMVTDDVVNDRVIPIKYDFDLNLPVSLYSWLTSLNGEMKAVVNMSLFPDEIKINSRGDLDAEPRTLFALLLSGALLRRTYLSFDKLKNNNTIIKNATSAYVTLFMKVIDKLFAIELYQKDAMKIRYMVTKFFLSSVLERQFKSDKDFSDYAYNLLDTTIAKDMIMEVDSFDRNKQMYSGTIDTFVTELEYIKHDKISGFTLRNLVGEWGNLFGTSTLLGLEHINYFLNSMAIAQLSTKLNKGYVITNTIGEQVSNIHNELIRVLYS